MTTTEMIKSIARRILSPMASFTQSARPLDDLTDVIGVYDVGDGAVPLWITTEGVKVGDKGPSFEYRSIKEVHAPVSKTKGDPVSTRVRLVLEDGTTDVVEVTGGRGRFCDSFEFTRFLARAVTLSQGDSA